MGTASSTSSQENWSLLKHFTFENGADIDRTVWESPVWQAQNNPDFFGQTNIRNPTDYPAPLPGLIPVVNNAAQMQLSTYDPNNPQNTTFLGSQIGTIEKWGLASYNSVAFEAEVTLPITGAGAAPGGVVAALFAYNLISSAPFLHDEIDFEISSNFWQTVGEQINTNVYVVTEGSMQNYDYVVANPTPPSLSGTVVLRIEWTQAGVKWYINKDTNPTPFYTETNVPQSDMSLVLNFWVPAYGWAWAYDPSLTPTGAEGAQNWTYQVNWAKVFVIENSITMPVQANQTWQNTGLTVVPGDTVTINYQSGLWTADPHTNGGNLYDANGFAGITVNQQGYTLPGANMGALCGFIGGQPVGDGSDNAFLVGDSYNETCQASGQLWLCINDDLKGKYGAGLNDNIGNVTVTVQVS